MKTIFRVTGRPSSKEPEDLLQVKTVKKNVIITRGHRLKPDDLNLHNETKDVIYDHHEYASPTIQAYANHVTPFVFS